MSEEVRNVEVYCPCAPPLVGDCKVVVLTVRGRVRGAMIEGVVEKCNHSGRCRREGFCWIGRNILTHL